jgi:hypothetical protein
MVLKPRFLLPLSFSLGLAIACQEDSPIPGGDCSPGWEGCDCAPGAQCLDGLSCFSGICVADQSSGETGDGNADAYTDKGEEDTGGDSCVPGELYCDCDGSQCAPGLECFDGSLCIPDECLDGTLGCECIGSAGCDNGLDCVNGTCIDLGDGEECTLPYESCADFDRNTFETCCEGTLCIHYEPDLVSGCTEPCSLHSDCATNCCANVGDGQDQYCSPTASFCVDYGLCIDTCIYTDDGDCDDGGPNSDFSLCEYGTDCADCGVRDW